MNKSERASTLLKDEWFQDEIESIRESLVSQIVNSGELDIDIRERMYLKIRLLDEIIGHFEAIAADNVIAKKRWKIF